MKKFLFAWVTIAFLLVVNLLKAQTAAVDNKLSQTPTNHTIPKGPSLFGVFEGRPPCSEIAKQLQISTPSDCVKLKWVLILYQDPATLQPTTFTLTMSGAGDVVTIQGNSFRQKILNGKWTIVKGIPSNEEATVYRLELAKPGTYFYFLKGDDNVFFVLDENKELRVGNEDFSYTLNRVELVPMKMEER